MVCLKQLQRVCRRDQKFHHKLLIVVFRQSLDLSTLSLECNVNLTCYLYQSFPFEEGFICIVHKTWIISKYGTGEILLDPPKGDGTVIRTLGWEILLVNTEKHS